MTRARGEKLVVCHRVSVIKVAERRVVSALGMLSQFPDLSHLSKSKLRPIKFNLLLSYFVLTLIVATSKQVNEKCC